MIFLLALKLVFPFTCARMHSVKIRDLSELHRLSLASCHNWVCSLRNLFAILPSRRPYSKILQLATLKWRRCQKVSSGTPPSRCVPLFKWIVLP